MTSTRQSLKMRFGLITTALTLIFTFVMIPTPAQAAGIPLSLCEKRTGQLPPTNGSVSWTNGNMNCNDSIYTLGGRTFFFQGTQSAINSKDNSYTTSTQLYVQDKSMNWISLGEAPRLEFYAQSTSKPFNFVETSKGLLLGGYHREKLIGQCGQVSCTEIRQYQTLMIDESNKVTKFTHPSAIGADKSPGFPFASGVADKVYFYQPIALINKYRKKQTASGAPVVKGKEFNYYHLDLIDNKLKFLPKISSLAVDDNGSSSIGAIGTLGNSAIMGTGSDIVKISPDDKFVSLNWKYQSFLFTELKNGFAAPINETDSIIFYWEDGRSQICKYLGEDRALPTESTDISLTYNRELFGSELSNTVSMGFYLTHRRAERGQFPGGMMNSININPDCSYSYNQFGDDSKANAKFKNEINNQVTNFNPAPAENATCKALTPAMIAMAAKKFKGFTKEKCLSAYDGFNSGTDEGQSLDLTAPAGNVFDKILQMTYEGYEVVRADGASDPANCSLDESKVQAQISSAFFGKNSGSLDVNSDKFGVKCFYNGREIEAEYGRFYVSVHYVPTNMYQGPVAASEDEVKALSAVSGDSTSPLPSNSGVSKWPAKCPKVINTAKNTEPLVRGFYFDAQGANFTRIADGSTSAVAKPSSVVGCYADLESLASTDANNWHIGTINHDKTGYYWMNAAGIRWGLTLSGSVMKTNKENPYFSEGNQFILKP